MSVSDVAPALGRDQPAQMRRPSATDEQILASVAIEVIPLAEAASPALPRPVVRGARRAARLTLPLTDAVALTVAILASRAAGWAAAG